MVGLPLGFSIAPPQVAQVRPPTCGESVVPARLPEDGSLAGASFASPGRLVDGSCPSAFSIRVPLLHADIRSQPQDTDSEAWSTSDASRRRRTNGSASQRARYSRRKVGFRPQTWRV